MANPGWRAQRKRQLRRRRIVALGLVVAVLASVWWLASTTISFLSQVPIEVKGLRNGLVGAANAAAPEIRVGPNTVSITVDGIEQLPGAQRASGRWLIRPPAFTDGPHTVIVTVDRAFLPRRSRTLRLVADTVAPEISLQAVTAVDDEQVAVIQGTVPPETAIRMGSTDIPVTDGAFRIEVPAPAPAEILLLATDPAGNETTVPATIPTVQPPTRAVHMSALAWVTPVLRDPVLQMLDEGRINAIQLDVKDESGDVGPRTTVELAQQIGAATERYVLADAVADIHRRGGRVIARIVALRDPRLAQASWDAGRKDDVIQTPEGERYGAYGGGFLNANSRAVQDYTAALATEAARAGVDDILLDYIRRPDGNVAGMVFPGIPSGDGLEKSIEDALVAHMADLHGQVRAAGGRLGASVYGISATRPEEIAQDIPRLARHLDFVSPMLYPSHWAKGEYGIAEPNRSPGPITTKALADFQKATVGTPAALVPWFQDFTLGIPYGAAEVRAQIDAAARLGVNDFLLWDAQCTYTERALDPRPA